MRGKLVHRALAVVTVAAAAGIASAGVNLWTSPFTSIATDAFSTYALTPQSNTFRGSTILGGQATLTTTDNTPPVWVYRNYDQNDPTTIDNSVALGPSKTYDGDFAQLGLSVPLPGPETVSKYQGLFVLSNQPYGDVNGNGADAPLDIKFTTGGLYDFGANWNQISPLSTTQQTIQLAFLSGGKQIAYVQFGDGQPDPNNSGKLMGPDLTPITADKWGYAGWQTPTTFDEVKIYGCQYAMDNVSIGNVPPPVPEPASIAAVAIGCGLLLRRRKKS